MKRQPSILRKILVPYLLLIIGIPLVVLILANLSLRAYAFNAAKSQISGTFDAVRVLIRDQLNALDANAGTPNTQEEDSTLLTPEQRRMNATLRGLSNALRVIRQTSQVELVVLQDNGRWILPKALEDSPVPALLLDRISNDQIQKIGKYDTVAPILERSGNMRYLVSAYRLPQQEGSTNPSIKLYMIASLNAMDQFILRLNRIFLISIMAAVVIGTIASYYVSKSLARPIQTASRHAHAIRKGNYVRIDENASAQEITDLYESLNTMSAALESSETEQSAYFQNLSHDLRTPLMSIQGYAEGIRTGVLSDYLGAAKIISEESIRLKQLVDQLLTLSRLETSFHPPKRESIELKLFLDSALGRLHQSAQDKKVNMILNCPDHLTVISDEGLLEAIVTNLCANGIRYARQMVMVDVAQVADQFRISVQDDGPGIAPEVAEHLFERFNKGKDGQQGLGLAIVKAAVDKLGGSIHVKQTRFGTIFEITNLSSI